MVCIAGLSAGDARCRAPVVAEADDDAGAEADVFEADSNAVDGSTLGAAIGAMVGGGVGVITSLVARDALGSGPIPPDLAGVITVGAGASVGAGVGAFIGGVAEGAVGSGGVAGVTAFVATGATHAAIATTTAAVLAGVGAVVAALPWGPGGAPSLVIPEEVSVPVTAIWQFFSVTPAAVGAVSAAVVTCVVAERCDSTARAVRTSTIGPTPRPKRRPTVAPTPTTAPTTTAPTTTPTGGPAP